MTVSPAGGSIEAGDLAAASLQVILDAQASSGAFIAGPTFEQYRYAWFRDGAFIAEALDLVGQLEPARRFHDWVVRVILAAETGIERSIAAAATGGAPDPADYLHCRYAADGSPGPDDWPTFQLDGPGIWLWSLGHHRRHGGRPGPDDRRAMTLVARYLAALWEHPSFDAWEESPEHVHTSTLAGIMAGLCAAAELLGRSTPPIVGTAIQAIDGRLASHRTSYPKWEGNAAVDASLLWLCMPYRLVGPDEAPFAETLRRIEADLVSPDGGVHRYANDTYYGGGEWLLLTAALGRVYLRRAAPGDRARAEAARRWIEAQAGSDGLLPEQVDRRALAPDRIAAWIDLWGPSARPLTWSHATYLALVTELDAGDRSA